MTKSNKTARPKKSKAVRLKKTTIQRMKARKTWRRRAVEAVLKVCTWKTGETGREDAQREAIKCMGKISEWFRTPSAALVMRAIQRRGVAAYRDQFNNNTTA